ncbi:hypothetical protein S7711_07885 [Stachybotrys chartarum IBT 7711]|uniref:Uncharacterized protein n=1 Tax=Stachybotrys chartarum (strain CBS 109288 / IBT 7711) TaxID=1280523 RepID=A0A084AK07_STACB|nr:hypothetical protein S7711_07885 [Stachybotrys chartarum IBT 7711]KFA48939.1 hypothetical protein S40293_02591 [Stachybotrys chartarum IBT 40293]KFA76469.1 hypothetical protein S40288_06502 [Stachybotrys chartarum IBT 40288]
MAMAANQPPYPDLDEKTMQSERGARDARRASRNGPNAHYRRARSPQDEAHRSGDELRSPTSDIALQDAMIAQAQAQRAVQVNGQQPRNAGQRRSNAPMATPAFFGPPMQGELDPHGNPAAKQGAYRRSAQQPGAARQSPPSNRHSRRLSESQTQQQQSRSPPSPVDDPSMSGATINRLKSPSIMKSVLQPLELKVHEYEQHMVEEQAQMASLDEEIRNLQERRRQAEERFLEAKAKHDDYERQHQDVSRAMRGEFEVKPPHQHQQHPPHMQQMSMPALDRMDSYDDRPVSEHSYRKPKKGGFRMSLFRS